MRIVEHPKFDLDDLCRRFELAKEQAGQDLRRLFDNTRKLGLSLVKYLGLTCELSDLVEILPKLKTTCFDGTWKSHQASYVLERSGCPLLHKQGSFACDYWREALDGLVMGLCEDERLARHKSCGHGDLTCVDVLFQDRESVRLAPVSNQFLLKLNLIQTCFESQQIRVVFKGLLEDMLYYDLKTPEEIPCGDENKNWHDELKIMVANFLPDLKLQDASPLAVIGGEL